MNKAMDVSTTGRHIPALDGLRGMAVLLVLFFHLFAANTDPSANLLVRFVAKTRASCWIGVDLFFVLSGFLLTGILVDTLQSQHYFRNFYGRRSLRVFPVYYLFFAAVLSLSLLQGYRWFSGLLYYLTYTISLLLFPVSYTTAPWININHFWSLAVEEQFYLLWPLAIFLLRSRRKIAIAAIAASLLALFLRIYLEASGVTLRNPFVVYAWSPARVDALLDGALLAILLRSAYRAELLRRGRWVFLAGALVLGSYTAWRGSLDPLEDPIAATLGLTLLGITFAGLLAATLPHGGVFSRIFSNRVLRFFGRYSYGLYVYHYTLKATLDPVLEPVLWRWTHSKLAVVAGRGSITLLLTTALAVLSFHFFERRFLVLKRYFQDETPTPKLRQDVRAAEAAM